MMNFKRLLSVCLVTLLTFALSIPAYASENPSEPEEVCGGSGACCLFCYSKS